MTCLPKAGKCEWADLKHFVAHFNQHRMTTFQHTCCLDLSGSERQPEVLCTDESGLTMVIERKGLFWPTDYVQQHKVEHKFWDLIQFLSGEETRHASYSLRVNSPGVINDRAIKKLALDLSVVLKPFLRKMGPGECISFAEPIPGEVRREFPGERDHDDWETGLCIDTRQSEYKELLDPLALPTEFVETLRKNFESSRQKFHRYADSRKVLLLNFTSIQLYTQLNQPWWAAFLRSHPQEGIDEIWSTFEYVEGEWGFDLLFARQSEL